MINFLQFITRSLCKFDAAILTLELLQNDQFIISVRHFTGVKFYILEDLNDFS